MIISLEVFFCVLHLVLFLLVRKKKISLHFYCYLTFYKGLSFALVWLKFFIHPVQHYYFVDDNIFAEVVIFLNFIYFLLIVSYFFFQYLSNGIKTDKLQFLNREIHINYFNFFVVIFIFYDFYNIKFISVTIYNEIFYSILIPSFFLIFNETKIKKKIIPIIFVIYYFLNKTSICFNYTLVEFLLIMFLVLATLHKLTWFRFGIFVLTVILSFLIKDLVKERVQLISCKVSKINTEFKERKIRLEAKSFFNEIKNNEIKKLFLEKSSGYLDRDSGDSIIILNIFNERIVMRYNSPNHALSAVMYDENIYVIDKYKKYFALKILPTFISNYLYDMRGFNQNEFGRAIGLIDSKDLITALTIPNLTYLYILGGKLIIIIFYFFIPLIFIIHKKLDKLIMNKHINTHLISNSIIFITYNLIGNIEQGTLFDIAKKYCVFILIFWFISRKINLEKFNFIKK